MRRWLCMWVLAVVCACGPSASPGPDGGLPPNQGVDAGRPDAGLPLDGGGLPADAGFDAGVTATVLRVRYPAGSHTVSVRGSLPPLSWDHGVPMHQVNADTWEASVTVSASLEWKPLLDDSTWSKGPNWLAAPGETREVFPRFNTDTGTWSRPWPSFHSQVLNNTRGVYVYLPPTYLENSAYRAPVLYMHDGQNLFDPSASFGGVTWQVADAMNGGAQDGTIAEFIVVGPENVGAARLDEYTPTADPMYGGGHGDAYLTMLRTELKPQVDAQYRTRPERENTALLGSSLGGLISAYAGTTQAGTFGLIGAMSPSTWWDNRVLLTEVAATPASPRPLRVYVDSGDSGNSNDDVDDTRDLATAYRNLGYVDGVTLKYVVGHGDQHSEGYWAKRLPGALQFLLGPRR